MAYFNGKKVFVPIQLHQESGSTHNYSTDEQVIGTWIDGKPLYETTVVFAFSANDKLSFGDRVYQHNIGSLIPDMDMSFATSIIANDGTDYNQLFSCVKPTDDYSDYDYGAYYSASAKGIRYFSNSEAPLATSYDEIYATIRYTKTTDTANS